MASITIRNIDDELKQRLKERAAARGRTMEAEARGILQDALAATGAVGAPDNLYAAIRAIVEPIGGIELEPFPPQPVREPPELE